jgi:N-acetylglucosamine-6-phosphate deacetylase
MSKTLDMLLVDYMALTALHWTHFYNTLAFADYAGRELGATGEALMATPAYKEWLSDRKEDVLFFF